MLVGSFNVFTLHDLHTQFIIQFESLNSETNKIIDIQVTVLYRILKKCTLEIV